MKSVCIICGGDSHEHEISLVSAYSVLKNIDREKYDVHTLIIDKKGNFFHTKQTGELKAKGWKFFSDLSEASITQGENFKGIIVRGRDGYREIPIDVFFPVLHGENGEDGVIQGALKMSRVAYVGSGVLSSATCMDKEMTHMRLDAAGIKTAPYIVLKKDEYSPEKADDEIIARLGYPVFIKPANAGSSVGVGKVSDKSGLKEALDCAFEVDCKVLVEKCIVGAEVECAVLGNENPVTAGRIGQIAPTAEFYDFDAKYNDNSTGLFIPAHVSEEASKAALETAVRAYKTMGCEGLARVDFFALDNGSVILNEINNLPGFTSISMYPKLFEAAGVPYRELIDKLIETARVK